MTPNDVITSSTRRTHCATLLAVGPWPPPWRDNGKHNKTFPSELIMFGFAAQSLLLRPLSWARAQATPVCMTFWRSKSCLKTNKSAAKRFRVQGNGKLKRNHAGASHNTGFKSRSRNNRLRQSGPITEPKIEKRMKILLGR